MNKIKKNNEITFENIKHIDKYGNEYWLARELMKVLSYKDWRYFDAVIEKSKIACQNSRISDIDHFVVNNKMVSIGSGAKRQQKDYKLSRYACYLIAQNANPRLKVVALAQTYFAVQTRKQEINENLGLTNFKGEYPTRSETEIAKNYLTEEELNVLNRMVSAYLDIAEINALDMHPMTMKDWITELDTFLKMTRKNILKDNGKISHVEALKKAHAEYDKFIASHLTTAEKDYLEAINMEVKRLNIID